MHGPDVTEPSTAWEHWELDASFFSALSRWTLEHPESSLDRVLDRVFRAIDLGQGLLEVIPDGPFPARGLVKAIVSLLRLGKDVSTAQREVHVFAKEVVHWVGEIGATLERNGGRFRSQATDAVWQNLAGIRDLIDEICKWAASRLLDQRWSLIAMKNKIMVKSEIADFKARLAEARVMFHELSIISQAQGMDRILKLIWTILSRLKRLEWQQVSVQGQISSMLQKIQITQTNHFNRSSAEEAERRQGVERHQYVDQILSMHAVSNASYVEQGKSPCDGDTRVDTLREIMNWIEDIDHGSPNFLWLTGDPGCGKSAITASIARGCKDKGFLFAQFFINRNNVDTTNPNAYFPSIARQLAARSDQIELELHDRLKAKPSVIDQVSFEQARSLFIDTMQLASQLSPKQPLLVVIDGLDETDRQHLKKTADIFSFLFNELLDHPNAKILISSRTEDDIRGPFAKTMNNKCVKHLHLDTADESSIKDVSLFLRRQITRVVLDNELDWQVWPGDERMSMLNTRSSGLFIWAVTAVKFIQEQIETWGTECLESVLNRLNSDGMGDINALYSLILQFTYNHQMDTWAFETFRRLVGTIVVLQEPLCLDDIGRLLDLRRSKTGPPVDVVKFVKRLRTILVSGTDAIDGQTVPRLHKSFFEFITNDDRVESQFHIDSVASHREVALQSLRQLVLARSVTSAIQLPGLFRYAFKFWSQHLALAYGATSGVVIGDGTLTPRTFTDILQRSSNNGESSPTLMAFSQDRSSICAFLPDQTRFWDASTGTLPTSSFHFQRTDFRHAFAFEHKGRGVMFTSGSNHVQLYNCESGDIYDRPLILNELGRNSNISCTTLLPTHNLMASASEDSRLSVWNSQNGQLIFTRSRKHTNHITCLTFSPQGYWLAVGYGDGATEILTAQDTEDSTYFTYFDSSRGSITNSVCSLKFSQDGALLLSGFNDGTLRMWHTKTTSTRDIHQYQQVIFKRHKSSVMAVAFLPNASMVITGSADSTIRFWSTETGDQIGSALKGHTDAVSSIDVSPDGMYILSGSKDKTVRVWNVSTREIIGAPLSGHSDGVHAVSFSPSGDHIASACQHLFQLWGFPGSSHSPSSHVLSAFSTNGEQMLGVSDTGVIQLWTTSKPNGITLKGLTLPLAPKTLCNIAFSPDGSRVTASTADEVYLWDAHTGDLITSSQFETWRTGKVPLSFTQDAQTIITSSYAGMTRGLEMIQGKLEKVILARNSVRWRPPTFFDVDKGSSNHTFPDNVQWLPSKDPDSGLWAYIDNHIIRAQTNGAITVVAANLEENSQ